MTVSWELYPYPFVMYLIMSICFSLCVDWISVPPTNSYDFLGNQFYYTEYRPLLFCWGRTPGANTIGSTGVTFNNLFNLLFYILPIPLEHCSTKHAKRSPMSRQFLQKRAMEKLYKMFTFKKTHILILQSNSFHRLLLIGLWLIMHVSSESKFN